MFFFFKQKTAYELRISDWSSDVCSSDLVPMPNTSCLFQIVRQHVSLEPLLRPGEEGCGRCSLQGATAAESLLHTGSGVRLVKIEHDPSANKEHSSNGCYYDKWARPEERRVGQEGVSTSQSSW